MPTYPRCLPTSWPSIVLTDDEQDAIRVALEGLQDPDAAPVELPTPAACVVAGEPSMTLLAALAHVLGRDLVEYPIRVYLRAQTRHEVREGRERREEVIPAALIAARLR